MGKLLWIQVFYLPSKVAKNGIDACALVEAGFEYVCDFDNTKISRSENARLVICGQTPLLFQHGGAGGGIRTHGGLRQRILSPPPCLRLFSGPPI